MTKRLFSALAATMYTIMLSAQPGGGPGGQKGPGGARGQMKLPLATESKCYSEEEKAMIREVSEKFLQAEYKASNGVTVRYNLFVPEDYDPAVKYPLVLFVHDAGPLSEDVKTTLLQGTGAIYFASPQDQAKHPCFVLAPQYSTVLDGATSDQGTALYELLGELCSDYSIDRNRLYNTGQSMGGMFALASNIEYPDLFAASFLVACQWETDQFWRFASKPMWIVVAEGDPKAYPGMQEGCKAWEAAGAKIAEAEWDGARMKGADFDEDVAQMLEADANIRFSHFTLGTVESSEFGGPAKEHMATWPVAYRITGIRDWLFTQTKEGSRDDAIRARLLDPSGTDVLAAARYGDWHGSFENSLHSIWKAVEKGADIATLEVKKTADGQIICFSDDTVDRLLEGSGKVSEMTLAEIRSLSPKEYKGPAGWDIVPTLAEAIAFSRGKILLHVSLNEYFDEVLAVIKEEHAENQVILKSRKYPGPGFLYMPVFDVEHHDDLSALEDILALNPVGVEIHFTEDDAAFLAPALEMVRGKARIAVNTIGIKAGSHHDPERGNGSEADRIWGELIRKGATVIFTDQVKPLMRYLAQ